MFLISRLLPYVHLFDAHEARSWEMVGELSSVRLQLFVLKLPHRYGVFFKFSFSIYEGQSISNASYFFSFNFQ